MRLRPVFLVVCLVAQVASHGAVTDPPPRNAIDSDEAPWSNGVPTPVPFEPFCPFPQAHSGDPRNLSATNGQACFWFSNGCTIGCSECNGNTRGPIPWRKCPDPYDGSDCRRKEPGCPEGASAKATNCATETRTVNTDIECGADNDWYYYSPWRAPGRAPVFDACGLAGGRTKKQGDGGFGASYINTTHAKQGDEGSKTLKPTQSKTKWMAGKEYEVAFTLQANHGGGYQYRLCPRDSKLDEECFQKMPVPFTGKQGFRWGGVGGSSMWFNGTYVSEGTVPAGSTWAMNPVPRNDVQTGKGFTPRCTENPDCDTKGRPSKCKCSGMWGPYDLEIIDVLKVPEGLHGDYVLGWRWDCEESSQIWSSCSDITIVSS